MTHPRRIAWTMLFTIVFLALSSVSSTSTVSACSCSDQPLAAYADEVIAAFVGQQVDRVVEDDIADNGAELTFQVDEVYAGDVPSRFAVRTHAQGATCGLDLSNAGTVGVAVFEFRGEPTVSLCGSTVTAADLRAQYGPASAPAAAPTTAPTTAPPDDDGASTVARFGLIGILVLILAAGGIVVARSRRSD